MLTGSQCDQRHFKTAGIADNTFQLRSLTRPGQGKNNVIAVNHAEIAMIGFRRMHKKRRGSGGRKSCRQLGADMTAFADTGHNNPSLHSRDRLNRLLKRLCKPVLQRIFKSAHTGFFNCDCIQGGADSWAVAAQWTSLTSFIRSIVLLLYRNRSCILQNEL